MQHRDMSRAQCRDDDHAALLRACSASFRRACFNQFHGLVSSTQSFLDVQLSGVQRSRALTGCHLHNLRISQRARQATARWQNMGWATYSDVKVGRASLCSMLRQLLGIVMHACMVDLMWSACLPTLRLAAAHVSRQQVTQALFHPEMAPNVTGHLVPNPPTPLTQRCAWSCHKFR